MGDSIYPTINSKYLFIYSINECQASFSPGPKCDKNAIFSTMVMLCFNYDDMGVSLYILLRNNLLSWAQISTSICSYQWVHTLVC